MPKQYENLSIYEFYKLPHDPSIEEQIKAAEQHKKEQLDEAGEVLRYYKKMKLKV